MIKWPDSLIKDLAAGRCVVFLGSGVSCNAQNAVGQRPKAWRALLEQASAGIDAGKKRVVRKCLDRYDYLMACELVKKALGTDAFNDFLRNEFQTPGYQPANIHKDVLGLYAPIVITPNFDKIYDSYVTSEVNGTIPILNYYSNDIIDQVRSGKQIVLNPHCRRICT